MIRKSMALAFVGLLASVASLPVSADDCEYIAAPGPAGDALPDPAWHGGSSGENGGNFGSGLLVLFTDLYGPLQNYRDSAGEYCVPEEFWEPVPPPPNPYPYPYPDPGGPSGCELGLGCGPLDDAF